MLRPYLSSFKMPDTAPSCLANGQPLCLCIALCQANVISGISGSKTTSSRRIGVSTGHSHFCPPVRIISAGNRSGMTESTGDQMGYRGHYQCCIVKKTSALYRQSPSVALNSADVRTAGSLTQLQTLRKAFIHPHITSQTCSDISTIIRSQPSPTSRGSPIFLSLLRTGRSSVLWKIEIVTRVSTMPDRTLYGCVA